MIYKSKETGELVTKATMLKAMAEKYKNPEPDDLAIMEHFLLVIEEWEMGQIVQTRALYEAVENLQFFLKVSKAELDIVKIALSNLIGTTQNEELRIVADGLFTNIMAGTCLEDPDEND